MKTTSLAGLALAIGLGLAAAACGPGEGTPDADPGFDDWEMEALSADQGFSLRTPVFDVPQGSELQDCYFFQVPDDGSGTDLWVSRTKTAINPGSHHMNVFRVKTIVGLGPSTGEPVSVTMEDGSTLSGTVVRGMNGEGECFDSANWADWPLVANSQNSDPENPFTDWQLPPNVAHRFSPGEMLMVQVHYVNATTQATPFKGRVGINFYRSTDAAPEELGTLFATQQSIRVCQSDPQPEYSGTCRFPAGADIKIVATNGHFHSRGRTFEVWDWDGQSLSEPTDAPFYFSDSWDEPPMTTYDNPLQVPAGGGIWWTCAYQWQPPAVGCDEVNAKDQEQQGDCCYTFGPEVETNEHCNVFLYYWPKVDSTDIFCN